MDPLTLGLIMAIGAGSAAFVSRIRRGRRPGGGQRQGGEAPRPRGPGPHAGDVLLYLGDEYWLAGELSLVREGALALRVFPAPDRGTERWVALPRGDKVVMLLEVDAELAALGWPGVEVPSRAGVLRRTETSQVAIVPAGEVPRSWEGIGRYALFRGLDTVALVVEGPTPSERLALVGREVPRALVEVLAR